MVELLVAMTLFVVLISISSGAFIQSMRTQRAATALIAANSNAQLAIEQMAREMRTGQNFSASGNEISFKNAAGENVIYRLNAADEAIERSIDAVNFKKITAENVKVKNLNFRLFQGTASDPYPPRITISLRIGASGVQIEGVFVDIQTTVSSRI
jgi:type II secretory pathway pseudopilin PulG